MAVCLDALRDHSVTRTGALHLLIIIIMVKRNDGVLVISMMMLIIGDD